MNNWQNKGFKKKQNERRKKLKRFWLKRLLPRRSFKDASRK